MSGIMKSEWISKYWAELILLGIIFLTGFLDLWNIWNQGFDNPYYAAAVRSMLSNPGLAFFNSFDAVGFVTVDKPPVGIWAQAASAAVFGFSNWSVIIPQALAGIGSVVLIYFIVKRPFGKLAGLISAFALAITPIFVMTSRLGTMDTQLIFVILLAVWIALKAARDHSFWLLILSAVLVGIGFNIKMIQAFVVVPAIIAIYLFGAALPPWKKIIHLSIALLVLAAVSLSWAIVVDAIPADQRPYIGSSGDNSVFGLMLGHNGVEAFVGATSIGNPPSGPFRLFSQGIDIYFSWLLPFALISLFVWWRRPVSYSLAGIREIGFFSEKGITLIALCLWLLPGLLYFSCTVGHWEPYYLATIAPPLAGLVGIGAVAMYREYWNDRVTGWVLVLAVLVTGLVQAWMESRLFFYDPLGYGLILVVDLVGCILCVGILVWLRAKNVQCANGYSVSLACIAVAVLFVAPAVWSCSPLMKGSVPDRTDIALADFLRSHEDNETYIAAVPDGEDMGASLIIRTGKPVMALGGYFGADQILPASNLPYLIHSETVRYFLVPANDPTLVSTSIGIKDVGENAAIYTWVTDHCMLVPSSEWSGIGDDTLILRHRYALYDCAGAV
jgi:4-amino-4-deoxy-L-arabinose transferase-like glycosyltransferase